jgi:MerR family transcriptional regulator, light-induced transcriptional regulator
MKKKNLSKKLYGEDVSFFAGNNSFLNDTNKEIYSIKDIEYITGIKAHTIRIWEQRYHLLIPKRSETNIRYYDDADLRFLLNVSLLNNNGIKISHIADMSKEEISQKCNELAHASHEVNGLDTLTDTMMAFDEKGFKTVLSQHVMEHGMEDTMSKLIFPFLERCGILWITGKVQPAHEHFVSNLIRQKLHVAIENHEHIISENQKKFLLFIPSGETHDIGLLFASYMLRSRGQKVIYLGSSLPYEDLRSIMKTHRPDFLFSTITAISSKINIQHFVDTLSKEWQDTTILLSGNQILNKRDLEVPANVQLVFSPSHFSDILKPFGPQS